MVVDVLHILRSSNLNPICGYLITSIYYREAVVASQWHREVLRCILLRHNKACQTL